MKIQTRMVSIGLMLLVMTGCAQHPGGEPVSVVARPMATPWNDPQIWSPGDPSLRAVFQQIAQTAIGTPYVRGGTSPNGFDCSGFVQWAYRSMGVSLPRTAREQADVGVFVPENDLQVGDIVAFRHPRRGYHTGIYMGDDRFVHSPSKRQNVRYSSLHEPYFRDTYIGARRVAVSRDVDIAAAARRMAELKTSPDLSETLAAAPAVAPAPSGPRRAVAASRPSGPSRAASSQTPAVIPPQAKETSHKSGLSGQQKAQTKSAPSQGKKSALPQAAMPSAGKVPTKAKGTAVQGAKQGAGVSQKPVLPQKAGGVKAGSAQHVKGTDKRLDGASAAKGTASATVKSSAPAAGKGPGKVLNSSAGTSGRNRTK